MVRAWYEVVGGRLYLYDRPQKHRAIITRIYPLSNLPLIRQTMQLCRVRGFY